MSHKVNETNPREDPPKFNTPADVILDNAMLHEPPHGQLSRSRTLAKEAENSFNDILIEMTNYDLAQEANLKLVDEVLEKMYLRSHCRCKSKVTATPHYLFG